MRTVTFYSYKGGVGRSLTLANLTLYLAQLGLHSIVIDLDLEAPGQHYKFGSKKAPLAIETGVIDILWSLEQHGSIDTDLVATSLHKIDVEASGSVHLLAAGKAPSPQYHRRLRQVDVRTLLGASDLGTLGLLELREVTRGLVKNNLGGVEPDFLFVDARTGATDLGGFAACFLADVLVTMFLDQPEHLEGTRAFLQSAMLAPRLGGPIQLLPVLTRAPDIDDHERQVSSEKLASYFSMAAEPLTATLQLAGDEFARIRHEPDLVDSEFVALRDRLDPSSKYQSDLLGIVRRLADQNVATRVAESLASALSGDRPGASPIHSGSALPSELYGLLVDGRFDFQPKLLVRVSDAIPTLAAAGDSGWLPLAEQIHLKVEAESGPDHPDTIRASANLAATLEQLGQYALTLRRTHADAEILKRFVFTNSERILGPDHPDTIRASENLAATLRRGGPMVRSPRPRPSIRKPRQNLRQFGQ